MAVAKNWKAGLVFAFFLSAVGIVYFGYFYCGSNCALKGNSSPSLRSNYDAYFAGRFLQNKFSGNELDKDYDLDLDEDVIVFLHIQKTGGTTFGKHLVENLEVDPPCNCYKRVKKHCDCLTKNKHVWLFSRYSTGWKCGLHADWTELKTCVDNWFQTTRGVKKRRYHYITLLRDPVSRFLSEWMHVRRGATWKTATLKCNGREATLEEVPFCYPDEDWRGVTLEQFINCPHNLAFNRQSRMMANLSKVNCYNTTGLTEVERDRRILESAKQNLVDLAFFGLVEFQTYTQFLFEHTLNINFINDFVQHNLTHSSGYNVSAEELRRIAALNHVDIELYQFAKDLFLQRVKQAYLDEELPVPEDLMRLTSVQAIEMEGGQGGHEGSPGSVEGDAMSDSPEHSELDKTDTRDALAQQVAGHIFQHSGLPVKAPYSKLEASLGEQGFSDHGDKFSKGDSFNTVGERDPHYREKLKESRKARAQDQSFDAESFQRQQQFRKRQRAVHTQQKYS